MEFDNNIQFGSREHYFHFMWGYLLPAVNLIINDEESKLSVSATRNKYFFRSCGPIMDILLNEFLLFHNINYEIINRDSVNLFDCSRIFVPRWDVWLINLKKHKNIRSLARHGKITPNVRGFRNLMIGINVSLFPRQFLSSISRLRNRVYSKIDFDSSAIFNKFLGKYLLIKRSSQPDYYKRGGNAEIPTYGSNRRKLMGIDEAANELQKNNIPVEVFQPGDHSLEDQILAFKACDGVIGIMGAEFSNLIWMEPNKKVVIFTPKPILDTPPVFKTLAKFMGQIYFEIIPSHHCDNVEIDSEIVIRALS